MPRYQPTPEVRLLGALCRRSFAANSQTQAETDELCAAVNDWQYFLRLIDHHRLGPPALHGAKAASCSIPEEVLAKLRNGVAINAREAFLYLAELQRLLSLFDQLGIRTVVLKGAPLAYLTFGDVAMREVGDIDLLIDPADAKCADLALQQAGLVRKEPVAQLSPKRSMIYMKYFKDYTYEPGNGFEIDLHWRLVRNTGLAEKLLPHAANQPHRDLQIGPITMRVLEFESCMLYLTLHGAVEGWVRWKSLLDVAALWVRATSAERSSTWNTAHTNGLAGYLSAALHLAAEWLGPLNEPDFEQSPFPKTKSEQRTFEYIVRSTHERMTNSHFVPPPAGESTFSVKLHETRLSPDSKSRLELAGRILFRPRMWETLDLPDSLFFLYPWLSPFEWFAFRLKRPKRESAKP